MVWSEDLPVLQVRIARQTNKLRDIEKFYVEGLGLKKIGDFENHQGYNGIMIGLPDVDYHLEFISHLNGSPGEAPTQENLLVLYFENLDIVEKIANKLTKMGYVEVQPENPFWLNISHTIEDPDGWRVVLVGSHGFSKIEN